MSAKVKIQISTERIEARITELEAARNDLRAQLAPHVARLEALSAAIGELRALLIQDDDRPPIEPPAEDNTGSGS